jgi:uncharacterized protein YneF (UPF0154 family)
MKQVLVVVVGAALVIGTIYGCYWVAKRVSYALFYEDMVIQTIKDTVKKEALR